MRLRRRFRVTGSVQGVGFRPFCYRTAHALGLAGFVYNGADGVHCEVEGAPEAVDAFAARLRAAPPPAARIEAIDATALPTTGALDFRILSSDDSASAGRIPVSPDLATCPACLADVMRPGDRRHRYPFTTCTSCGPRWTILEAVPYDRANTTMRGFALCPACGREYRDPLDRRYHAEPIGCPACGPQLWLRTATGMPVACADPILEVRRRIVAGEVVAVKGLGGYHLCCDAANADAVARVRAAKRRGDKPFALMVADLAAARALCDVSDAHAELLQSPAAPIVLCPARSAALVAPGVAPHRAELGLMLPYTPLHHLLLARPGACGVPDGAPRLESIVCTSANLSDEPLIADDDAMADACPRFADAQLGHTRPIRGRCDDSVAQIVAGAPMYLRRARGAVPGALRLPVPVPEPVLAIGGVLKAAAGIAIEDRVYCTPHLGDLDSVEGTRHYCEAVERLCALVGMRPEIVLYDRHPDGFSAAFAEEWPASLRIGVQHHEAHVYAAMGEAGLLDEPAIGLALDGYGWGPDGTSWGGEAFVVRDGAAERVARLRPVPQPGGDTAVREPWRMAVAHAQAADALAGATPLLAPDTDSADIARVAAVARADGLSTPTSSMGRLFDAAACLAGVGRRATYEAELAQRFEAAAHGALADPYPIALQDAALLEWDAAPIVRGVIADARAGVSMGAIAARFHATVVAGLLAWCRGLRDAHGIHVVCVGGGVWQNRLLTETFLGAATADGFTVHVPRAAPPNDGGLAYGQAVAALRRIAACV